MIDGIVLVDKPDGLTSHDVVARVRRFAGTKKVGHAGTLDPMATGLLVLGVNRATRLLTYLVGADKTYLATIRLGQATVSDDAEGEITATPGLPETDDEAVRSAVAGLTGAIEQVPSAVSAIKVDGKRSYARVRAGEDVDLPARPVTVHAFEVLARRPGVAADGTLVQDLDVEVRCSSGTYVRALARDLGAALDSAGHLTALRRTQVGDFDVAQAQTLTDLADDGVRALGMSEVARRTLPGRDLTDAETTELRYGRRVPPSGRDGVVAAFAPDGHVVALVTDRGEVARAVLVLDPA
ncbi:tRNA pseudouridine(55) synthase TruB [Occultella aeris]|uniref:tRNA pseudouridine synthase B n=1 Tax=Occultella aeris TaxID=2761496 RepID=A0A7M4DP89_9MICO|nr:tRNA pseudouridine(55) synthase TruB [Occultella aeris]VZO39275.1 tRNA pseudouridine synthase B [Occultella aeris]